jgi:hypothetical protein
MLEDVHVIVSSCDSFAACWPPLMHGFDRYWPDGPNQIHLITNRMSFEHPRVSVFATGIDHGWARNLRMALSATPQPFVLYMQEDYWINQVVDTALIDSYVHHFRQDLLDYLRLVPVPPGTEQCGFDDRIQLLNSEARYRTSLQAALWRKTVLLQLLLDDESPWNFERVGNDRSRMYGPRFGCVSGRNLQTIAPGNLSYVCTAINKGRWSTDAVRYATREGLHVDFGTRGQETWLDDFRRQSVFGRTINIVERVVRKPHRVWQHLRTMISGAARAKKPNKGR